MEINYRSRSPLSQADKVLDLKPDYNDAKLLPVPNVPLLAYRRDFDA